MCVCVCVCGGGGGGGGGGSGAGSSVPYRESSISYSPCSIGLGGKSHLLVGDLWPGWVIGFVLCCVVAANKISNLPYQLVELFVFNCVCVCVFGCCPLLDSVALVLIFLLLLCALVECREDGNVFIYLALILPEDFQGMTFDIPTPLV